MKKLTLLLLAFLMCGAAGAIDKTPAVMVSTSTNNYNVLTGKTAQADFDFIDDWLVAESNRLNAVSNLAQAAYGLAGTNNSAGQQRTYVYANTGTFVVATATIGETFFYAATQSIGQLHAGMFLTGSVFQTGANSEIDSVDYATRKVTMTGVMSNTATSASCSYWGGGTYTHVVPTNWARCKVTVTGGGGSGGADPAAEGGGGGGGGGGTSIGYWALTPGASYTVTIGAGGAAVTNATGNTGGTSSFGSLQTATGGAGGAPTPAGVGGAGGKGSGGILNLSGGSGEHVNWGTTGGTGGSSLWGGGGIGTHTSYHTRTRAVNYGAGGGGNDNGTMSGNGLFGVVVIEYF
jgi:hypothetical protein